MTAIVEDDHDEFKRKVDELFRENRYTFERIAFRITGNLQDSEDALQTGFMKLMERPCPPGLMENPVGYLHQVIENAALDIVRRRNRRPMIRLGDMEIPAAGDYPEVDDRIEQMRLALAQMKPRLVRILILCVMEGLSCKKVAKRLRMPLGTVYSDFCRAKFQVRKLIRIQEKRDEAQKTKRQRIPGPDMADPVFFEAEDGIRDGLAAAAGGIGQTGY